MQLLRLLLIAMSALVPAGLAVRSAGEVHAQNGAPVVIVPAIGHTAVATAFALSPDGRLVLSASTDSTIKLWDVKSGQLLRTLLGHEAVTHRGSTSRAVNAVAFSPDGRRAASAGADRTVRLWEIATGRLLRTSVANNSQVGSVAFSPDGRSIVSGGAFDSMWNDPESTDRSRPKPLRAWHADTGALLHAFGDHAATVRSVTISANGKLVAATGDTAIGPTPVKRVVNVYELENGRLVRSFPGTEANDKISFLENGTQIAIAGGHSAIDIKVWDIASGRRLWDGQKNGFELHAVREGGHFIASGERELPDGRRRRVVEGWQLSRDGITSTQAPYNDMEQFRGLWASVSVDGRSLVGLADNNSFAVWSEGSSPRIMGAENTHVVEVAFAQGDRNQLLIGDSGGWATFWNLEQLASRTMKLGNLKPTAWHARRTRAIGSIPHFSGSVMAVLGESEPNSQMCHSVLQQCASRVLDPRTLRSLLPLTENEMIIQIDPVQPPRHLATLDFKALKVRLWNLADLRVSKDLSVSGRDAPHDVTVSVNQKWLAWRSETQVTVVDIASGEQLRVNVEARDFDISTDEKLIATINGNGLIQIRSLPGLAVVTEVDKKGWFGVKFAARDQHLMVRGKRSIQIHSLTTGQHEEIGRSGGGGLHANFLGPDFLVLGNRYGIGGRFQLFDTRDGRLAPLFKIEAHEFDSISLSPDGTRIAAGVGRLVRIVDAMTGSTQTELPGHLGDVLRTAFSSDGRLLVSSSADGSVRVWNANTGREIFAIVARSDGQDGSPPKWIAFTPDGFFAASSTGVADMQAIVRGTEAWSLDQIWQSLYNPDLVREQIQGDPTGEVAAAAKLTNLAKVIASGPPPRVDILLPKPGASAASDTVTVKIGLTDSGKGVGRVEWRVNGLTSRVTHGAQGGGRTQETSAELALEPGDNTIEVVAYDAANLIASRPARTTLRLEPQSGAPKPMLHVLAVGVNAYTDTGWVPPGGQDRVGYKPLTLAVKDATAFAVDFKQAGGSTYADVRVKLVLNGDATRDNLERVVDKLAGQIHPRDTFVLYVAAHGASEDGRFYIVPSDFQSGPGALAASAIGQDRLQDWFANRIKARRAVILLDTCESGALVAGFQRSRTDVAASDAGIGRLHEATGRPVLTAAASGQAAKEGIKDRNGVRHGVFNVAVLDALRNGDRDNNGKIELSEMVIHVQDWVPRLAAMLGGGGAARSASGAINPVKPALGQQARFGSRGEDFVISERLP